MGMTKFEHGDDPGFTAVAGELRRWVKESTAAGNTEIPAAAALQQPQVQQQVEQQQGRLCM